jgi:hypothetical protein
MKSRKIYIFLICIALCSLFFTGVSFAQEGEEELFTTSTPPDALILFDLSGSMAWNPAGDDNPYGSSLSCTADTTHCTGSGCTGGFCGSSKAGCNINCSRLEIAKRAVFYILDDNNDGTINSADNDSLGVRIGYMNFRDCGTGSPEWEGNQHHDRHRYQVQPDLLCQQYELYHNQRNRLRFYNVCQWRECNGWHTLGGGAS